MKTWAGGRHRVILYGDSVFMASVEASLQRQSGLEVVWIQASLLDLEWQVSASAPDVVIIESCTGEVHDMLTFLQAHPDLPLIGLDPNRRVALLPSGKPQPVQTVGDLVQLLRGLTEVSSFAR